MILEKDIGKKIKEIRSLQEMILEVLAEKSGFTKGYLSKVENSEKAPPVSTLIKIAKILNVTVSEILGETESRRPICLVKKNQRRHLARDGTIFGYSYQTLAHPFTGKQMEPYILVVPPKPKENPLFQHEGEEMLFILEGTMKFFHGEREFIVEEGDCIYFDSGIPHYGICQEDKEVKCLMVIRDSK